MRLTRSAAGPVLFGLFLLTATAAVYGQDHAGDIDIDFETERELTLEQAIEIAVVNNSEIKRAIFSVQDADEQVRIAWGEVMPEVSSSATYTRNIEIPVNFLPAEFFGGTPGELIPVAFGTDNTWNGGVSVSQNIFSGEAIIGISSSEIFKSAQQENLRATMQQVVTESRKAFYGVLIAKEKLRLQQEMVNRLERNLQENQARLEAGLVDEYDVLRMDVQLANQEPLIRESEFAVQQAQRNLKLVLGLPVEMPLAVTGRLNEFEILGDNRTSPENRSIEKIDRMTPLPSAEEEDLLETMRRQRGDLRMLAAQDQLKDKEIRAIQTRFLPTLSADYNLRWTSAQPGRPSVFEGAVRYQTVGLTVSFPIFEGFQRRANINRAKIDRKDIREQTFAVERAARHEIDSAVERLNTQFETAPARKKALDQARRGYQIAVNRFDEGMGSQLEVTEAQWQVREAELNFAQMVYDYLTAKAQYDLALGVVPKVDDFRELYK